MIYGYARVSTDGQSVEAQVAELTAAGASKVFSETAGRALHARKKIANGPIANLTSCGELNPPSIARFNARLNRPTNVIENSVTTGRKKIKQEATTIMPLNARLRDHDGSDEGRQAGRLVGGGPSFERANQYIEKGQKRNGEYPQKMTQDLYIRYISRA
jgi:hypothetical protein